MAAIIEIAGLKKTFRRTRAVDGLSMDVPEGKITAFLGPNGAGKTTTIKCLLNLVTPDEGRVRVLGQDSWRLRSREFQHIGYVSENQDLPTWMTVRQLMLYCSPLYPTWDKAFAEKLRQEFDLPMDCRLRSLSRGMRMKAALLSNLAFRPKLVVLDEPFSGLDPLVRDEFIRGLLELTEQEGWSVFISSHDIAEVERLADTVAILHRGRLQLHEPATELQARFRRVEVVMEEEGSLPATLPGHWLNFERSGRMARFVHTKYSEADLAGEVARYWPQTESVNAFPMTLREIFVALARTYRLNGFDHAAPLQVSM
jgi:ABC-2 type transport system ATP-binding protein